MSYRYRIVVGLFFALLGLLCRADGVGQLYCSVIPVDKKLDAAWVQSLTQRDHALDRGIRGSKKADTLKYIGMPVGGFGCGTVYLSGDGRMYVWDIWNAGQRGVVAQNIPLLEGYPAFRNKKVIDVVSGSNFLSPLTFEKFPPHFKQGFGLKIADGSVRKFEQQHWESVEFVGTWPMGRVSYRDSKCPVRAELKAYSPFVPLIMPDDFGIWGHFNSNLWWNTNAKDFSAEKYVRSLAQWQQKQGKDGLFADPLFVDPVNRNYHVKENSPALKLGFKNFPMDQFGRQMTRVMCGSRQFEGAINVVIRADARGGEVRYTLDGSEPKADSALYTSPLKIDQTTTLCASTFNAQWHEVGFADRVLLTKVDKVTPQSWLASYLAGEYVGPVKKEESAKDGEPKHMQWAGMELVTISDYPDYIDASGGQFFGAFVVKLDEDSKAAAAGFKNGDTIIRMDSTEARNLDDLSRALKPAAGPVSCMVFRGYKHYELSVAP